MYKSAWFAKWQTTFFKNTTKVFCVAHLIWLKANPALFGARIARKAGSIIEREINPNGQTAITHYKLIQNYDDFCLVEFQLETGRTHQIRVHSKFIGHPILSDTLYGATSNLISRQALHAYKISFLHPITNQKMEFTIELPEDMKNILWYIKHGILYKKQYPELGVLSILNFLLV